MLILPLSRVGSHLSLGMLFALLRGLAGGWTL